MFPHLESQFESRTRPFSESTERSFYNERGVLRDADEWDNTDFAVKWHRSRPIYTPETSTAAERTPRQWRCIKLMREPCFERGLWTVNEIYLLFSCLIVTVPPLSAWNPPSSPFITIPVMVLWHELTPYIANYSRTRSVGKHFCEWYPRANYTLKTWQTANLGHKAVTVLLVAD